MASTSFYRYLPIADDLFHDGFYVTGAGRTLIVPGSAYPPQPHPLFYQFSWDEGRILPEFSLILITRGKGVFETEEVRSPVEAGSVILLFPGIWHRYRPDRPTGWTEKWIQFNGEFVHKLWNRGILSAKHPTFVASNAHEIEVAIEGILTEIERRPGANSLRYALQMSHVIDLVLKSQVEPGGNEQDEDPPLAQDDMFTLAENYIWTHSQLALSVNDIAIHLGVSRRTLERRFQARLGRTVLQEITGCRFNRAKRLLKETDLPIKSVVYLAGFGRPENMRQEFMKQTGLSPRSFRATPLHSSSTKERGGDGLPSR